MKYIGSSYINLIVSKIFRIFSFDGMWKNNWKVHISIVFVHDLSENQLNFLEKLALKKLWAFEVINFLCVC